MHIDCNAVRHNEVKFKNMTWVVDIIKRQWTGHKPEEWSIDGRKKCSNGTRDNVKGRKEGHGEDHGEDG